MSEYEQVTTDNSVEMLLAKEWYNWAKLDKAEEYWLAHDILKLANFLKKNAHKLKETT